MISLPYKNEDTVQGHNWVSLTYCDFNLDLVITTQRNVGIMRQGFSILTSAESWALTLDYFLRNIKTFNCNACYKRTKDLKCWIKLIQDLRGLIKVFSIAASTESLILILSIFFSFFFGVSIVCKLCFFQTHSVHCPFYWRVGLSLPQNFQRGGCSER